MQLSTFQKANNMTKNTKIVIGIGVVALSTISYFIFKKDDDKDEKKKTKEDKPNIPIVNNTTTTPTTTPPTTTPKIKEGVRKKYIVNTKSSNLNIRNQPSEKGRIVGYLSKGCEIEADTTSDIDWVKLKMWTSDGKCQYDYTESGNHYLSTKFLKEK